MSFKHIVDAPEVPQNCLMDNTDLPVLVVVGEVSVGKSSFLNYISDQHGDYDPCGFKTSPVGISDDPVAKKVRWRGTRDDLIVVDTPGLTDPQGSGQDRKIIKNIVNYLRDGLEGRKITTFLFLHKFSGRSKFNFKHLNMFHYMFGDVFWDHLVVEMTYWGHSPLELRRRGMVTQEVAAKEVNRLISNVTSIPEGLTIPVTFIYPIFNPDDYLDYSNKTQESIISKQNKEVLKMWNIVFNQPKVGFTCLETCNEVIPPDDMIGPMSRNPSSMTEVQSTELNLKCTFYKHMDESSDRSCDQSCNPGWTFNGTELDARNVSAMFFTV